MGFTIGAGDGNKRAIGRMRAALTHEELDVANDINAGGASEIDGPVRFRMRQGNARRKHEE